MLLFYLNVDDKTMFKVDITGEKKKMHHKLELWYIIIQKNVHTYLKTTLEKY